MAIACDVNNAHLSFRWHCKVWVGHFVYTNINLLESIVFHSRERRNTQPISKSAKMANAGLYNND